MLHTFEVSVFASFYLVQAAASLLPPGSSIILTSSGMTRRSMSCLLKAAVLRLVASAYGVNGGNLPF
jgi:NAD(P)-dependent dehydrogenase (short-subunit alcohol dehydrogenase family)